MKALTRLVLVGSCSFSLCGCDDVMVPVPTGMQPSAIQYYHDTVVVSVPTSARLNDSITVTVMTFGNGCLRKGNTEVTVRGRFVALRPFDLVPPPRSRCADLLAGIEHSATIHLIARGYWWIEVRGVKEPRSQPIAVRRRILVQ